MDDFTLPDWFNLESDRMATIGNDQVIVTLPYPIQIMGLKLTKRREIGFAFTNLVQVMFYNTHGLKTSNDLKKWQQENGMELNTSEVLYYSAIAYCQLNYVKPNFTKEGLLKALLMGDKTELDKLKQCHDLSLSFGLSVKKKPYRKDRIQ